MRFDFHVGWVLLLALLGACAPSIEVSDASVDAGTGVDAGRDAGLFVDGGSDSGVEPDSGFDAGPSFDAGHDAGHDGGFDAGQDSGFDAGTDAGPPLPVRVAYPRFGDLRTDAQADTLPATYTPPDAGWVHTQLTYGTASPMQQLDLYLPTGVGPYPVLVWLHSGGWIAGERSPVPDLVTRQLSRVSPGFAVAAVDYRLAGYSDAGVPFNAFPAAIHDIKTAVRWLKSQAATYNLLPSKIILVGASAGGHLAAFTAASAGAYEPTLAPPLASQDSSVAGVVNFVGPSDLVTFATGIGAYLSTTFLGCLPKPVVFTDNSCSNFALLAASPSTYLSATAPPAYLAYGVHDAALVVPATQGLPLAKSWAVAKGSGAAVWYEEVDAGHNIDESAFNLRAMEQFLDGVRAGTLK